VGHFDGELAAGTDQLRRRLRRRAFICFAKQRRQPLAEVLAERR
jgi:hypothetical protein